MNEYTAKGSVARSHSDNGNLLADGQFAYQWDYKNRLIAVFRASDMQPVAEYAYDAKNRRTRKRVYGVGGALESVTLFYYDGWTVCEEQDQTGNTLVTFVYGSEMDEVTQIQRTAVHPLRAGTVYLHQNVRGDFVAATSDSGAVLERRFYDDYGNVFDESKQPVKLSAVGNPYGFQGRRLDAETGLYYFRNRFYSAETGRFLQRDPVWDAGNVGGQYTFVGCGPVSRDDPLGLSDELDRMVQRRFSSDPGDVSQAVKQFNQLERTKNTPKELTAFLGDVKKHQKLRDKMASLKSNVRIMSRYLDVPMSETPAERIAREAHIATHGYNLKTRNRLLERLQGLETKRAGAYKKLRASAKTLSKAYGTMVNAALRSRAGQGAVRRFLSSKAARKVPVVGLVFIAGSYPGRVRAQGFAQATTEAAVDATPAGWATGAYEAGSGGSWFKDADSAIRTPFVPDLNLSSRPRGNSNLRVFHPETNWSHRTRAQRIRILEADLRRARRASD